MFLSIIECRCHKLLIAHGLTLVTPRLSGWEVFSTPGAPTHTRITWALSPMVPQVPGVTAGPPCAHGVLGTPHGEVCNNILALDEGVYSTLKDKKTKVMDTICLFFVYKAMLPVGKEKPYQKNGQGLPSLGGIEQPQVPYMTLPSTTTTQRTS